MDGGTSYTDGVMAREGFMRTNVDPERESWLTYGEPPVEETVVGPETTRAWLAQEDPETARAALDAWLAAGWPTPDAPDWLSGGYATKERVTAALRLLADRIDALRGMWAEADGRLNWLEQRVVIEAPPAQTEDPEAAGEAA